MKKYEEYLQLIKEGLIYTHNILKYEKSLLMQLSGFGLNCEIDVINKLTFVVTINNVLKLNDCYDLFFNNIINLYGYFPSYIYVTFKTGRKYNFKFDDEKLKKRLNKFVRNITIRFEAKYDDGVLKNDLKVPNKLYHLSRTIYREKIMENGLEPKTQDRVSKYPKRIYLFYFLDDYNFLLKKLTINDYIKTGEEYDYDLYEIDSSTLDIIIHSDPNFERGCFTYDNIHPKYIKKIIY